MRSDALDILFEHRNKQYGAYVLRRNYPRHLLYGLGTMVLMVMVAMYYSQVSGPDPNRFTAVTTCTFVIPDSLELTAIPPKPPITPPPPPSKHREAITAYTEPLIVADNQAETLPEQDILQQTKIGNLNQAGAPDSGIEVPVSSENRTGSGAAPIDPPMEEEPEILHSATVMPVFPGGQDALQQWLSRRLKPQESQDPGNRARVVVRFVVDAAGDISQVQLAQSAGDPFDAEVLRVIQKMPRWIPGKQHGRAVSVWFSIPVIFETPEQ